MVVQDIKNVEPYLWHADIGCINYISGSKYPFSFLNKNIHSTVRFGHCSIVKVIGQCYIKTKTNNGFV